MELDPVSRAEMNVFGESALAHPVTGMAIETGIGSLPLDQQAYLHCNVIEHHHGKSAADEMRARINAHIAARDDEAKAAALDLAAKANKPREIRQAHIELLKG